MNIDDSKDTIKDDWIPSIGCKSFDAFIVDYIDDNLTDEERRIFIKHMNECPPCKKYLDNYQNSIRLSQTAFSKTKECSKKEIPEQLISAILDARKDVK